jgi:hypothetical protein
MSIIPLICAPTQDIARLSVYPCNRQQDHPEPDEGRVN